MMDAEGNEVGKIEGWNSETEVLWLIPNYFSLAQEADSFYHSPVFHFLGSAWRLRIYPNGDRERQSVGFVGLYVRQLTTDKRHINYQMGIVCGNDQIGKRSYRQFFNGQIDLVGRAKYIGRRYLSRHRDLFAPDGILAVKFVGNDASTQTRTSWGQEPADFRHRLADFQLRSADIRQRTAWMRDNEGQGLAGFEVGRSIFSRRSREQDNEDRWSADFGMERSRFSGRRWEQDNEGQGLAGFEVGRFIFSRRRRELYNEGVSGLVRDFQNLLRTGRKCDVEIKVQNKIFPAHRIILEARSTAFAATFEHDTKEKNTGVVDIVDCDPSTFQHFLSFIYTGNIDNLSSDNAIGLYSLANKYDVSDLKEICLDFIEENMSFHLALDVLASADKFNEEDLINLAKKLLKQKDELTKYRLQFTREHAAMATKILVSDIPTDPGRSNSCRMMRDLRDDQPVAEEERAEERQPVAEEEKAERRQPVADEEGAERRQLVAGEGGAERRQLVADEEGAERRQLIADEEGAERRQVFANEEGAER